MSIEEEKIARAREFTQGLKLPAQTRIVLEINKEASSADPDLRKITTLVSRDVALSADLLKTINSPLFGLRMPVSSITQAMTLMGLNTFRKVILTSQLEKALSGGSRNESEAREFRKFWDHFMGAAKAAELVAKTFLKLGFVDLEEQAFLAGLFHDCGIPLLIQKYPEYVKESFEQCHGDPLRLRELETERYGFDHGVLSYVLSQSWGVDEGTCLAILHHHDRETTLTAAGGLRVWILLRLADYLAEYEAAQRQASVMEWAGFDLEMDRSILPDAVLDAYKLSVLDIGDLKEFAVEELGQFLHGGPKENAPEAPRETTGKKKKKSWF